MRFVLPLFTVKVFSNFMISGIFTIFLREDVKLSFLDNATDIKPSVLGLNIFLFYLSRGFLFARFFADFPQSIRQVFV